MKRAFSTILTAGLLAVGVTAFAGASLAGSSDVRHRHVYKSKSHQISRSRADERHYEHMRAEAYDPAGAYKGYPDWARYALSPKW